MVTAKREIKTEEERYGGYAPRLVAVKSRPASAASYYREYSSNDEFVNERYDEQFDSGIVRNGAASPAKVEEPVVIKAPTMPKRVFQPRVFTPEEEENDDLYPTSTTMRTIEAEEKFAAARPDARTRQRVKLNARGKAIIAGYAVVVIALITVIILNAVAIGGLSASVSALDNAVIAASGEVNGKNVELGNVSKPSVPEGMGAAGSVVEVTTPEVIPPASASSPTNWFDRFCDFLCGIFGG